MLYDLSMQNSLFVWLGSKRAKKRGVGETGTLLDLAARFRLPVPSGGILLDDFYRLAVEDGLFVAANGRVTCPDPPLLYEALYEAVRFPKLDKPVAVRPLFEVTDGRFSPQHNIQLTAPPQLSFSLCEVYSAAEVESERRDVLVMEMVKVEVVGTAVTTTSQSADTITHNGQHLTLPQLGIFQSANLDVPPFAQRLQKLLRGLRRTFGKGEWMINWADDGEICWILKLQQMG